MSAWHPLEADDQEHGSVLTFTEMVAALALFLATFGGLWIILGTLG